MQKVSRAEDQFDNIDDAKEKAKEIGCVGTHKMDKDGKTIYMPCGTHDAVSYTHLTLPTKRIV